jgi:hypothetical protein
MIIVIIIWVLYEGFISKTVKVIHFANANVNVLAAIRLYGHRPFLLLAIILNLIKPKHELVNISLGNGNDIKCI